MTNQLKIREYNSNDKPEVLEILKLNVPEYFAESEINDLDEYLEHKIDRYFVIESGNRIIGAGGINFEDNNTTGKISWDFVHPEFQRKGAGQKLLRYRIDLLRSIESVENIKVRTSQFAYKFYKKNGFHLENIVKGYWGKGFDLYEMSIYLTEADNTAVRTALWRALHVQADAKPYILEDETGLKLIAPPDDWQQRPDMKFTKRLRASVIARSRFIEDLITEQSKQGVSQYVILGAGLDTFAQRRPDIASRLQIYEIDQAATLAWKQQRLIELGFGVPEYLHFVPVNFEVSSWWEQLLKAGFDTARPAVVVCTGVSLYLTKEAIASTLKQIAVLAPGSKLAMTFYLPMELLDEEDKPMQEIAEKGARAAGTPFVSFFAPNEILALAREAGFREAKTISTKDMEQYYFMNRTDDLLPASGEVFLMAAT